MNQETFQKVYEESATFRSYVFRQGMEQLAKAGFTVAQPVPVPHRKVLELLKTTCDGLNPATHGSSCFSRIQYTFTPSFCHAHKIVDDVMDIVGDTENGSTSWVHNTTFSNMTGKGADALLRFLQKHYSH